VAMENMKEFEHSLPLNCLKIVFSNLYFQINLSQILFSRVEGILHKVNSTVL
jgi:hypothetical protein